MLSATERGLRAVGRARFAHEPQASAAFTGGERCRSTVDGSSLCAVGASNKQRNPGLAPSARADRSPKGAPKSPVHTGSEPARKFASARTNLQNLGSSDGAHAVHAEVEWRMFLFVVVVTTNGTMAGAAKPSPPVPTAEQPEGTKVDLRVGLITNVWTHDSADKWVEPHPTPAPAAGVGAPRLERIAGVLSQACS